MHILYKQPKCRNGAAEILHSVTHSRGLRKSGLPKDSSKTWTWLLPFALRCQYLSVGAHHRPTCRKPSRFLQRRQPIGQWPPVSRGEPTNKRSMTRGPGASSPARTKSGSFSFRGVNTQHRSKFGKKKEQSVCKRYISCLHMAQVLSRWLLDLTVVWLLLKNHP